MLLLIKAVGAAMGTGVIEKIKTMLLGTRPALSFTGSGYGFWHWRIQLYVLASRVNGWPHTIVFGIT